MTKPTNDNRNGDDSIERLWANRKEETPMSREEIASALRPRVGRTTWTLKFYLWTYLGILLATLVLQGMNLAGYRSNSTMLTVHSLVMALAVGFTAFGIHLVGRVGQLDRMDESLAKAVEGRLTFLRGKYEVWLWACAATLPMLTWAVTTLVDNANGVYRINKPWVFLGTLLAMFFGAYAVLKGAHVPVLHELRAVLEDLEGQLLGRTGALDELKVKWRRWGYVLMVLFTLLLLLGIWRAFG
jgi:hypothetical protein